MSGKRIHDAMALLSASRNIAVKHFEIRLSQVELYNKTSSFSRAIQSRTNLAASNIHASSQSFSNLTSHGVQHSQETTIPAQESVAEPKSDASKDSEPMSDHHYERSTENTVVDPAPQQDLDIEQEKAKRQPLPDGTIPPNDSATNTRAGAPESFSTRHVGKGNQDVLKASSHQEDLTVTASDRSTIPGPGINNTGLSSEEARILQRQSESQIPARPADPPQPTGEFGVEQEQDVFYQPPGTTSPVLSALPRIRVPKVEWDVQGGDSRVTGGINPDVFYSGCELPAPGPVAEEEPTKEMLSQLFHSSKVSRMLGKKGSFSAGGPRAFHAVAHRQVELSNEEEDLKRLAADMAKDVHSSEAVSNTDLWSL